MSKGCDKAFLLPDRGTEGLLYRGENPTVVTDATCFMDWIADQYHLTLPKEYTKKASCTLGRGDRMDFNKPVCKTNLGTYCNFEFVDAEGEAWDSCRLLTDEGREGLAFNVNRCIDGNNDVANCANNCKGVDPNAIIGAGVAAVATTGLTLVGFLGPALGIGGIGAVGAAGGALMTRMDTCQFPLCRVGSIIEN